MTVDTPIRQPTFKLEGQTFAALNARAALTALVAGNFSVQDQHWMTTFQDLLSEQVGLLQGSSAVSHPSVVTARLIFEEIVGHEAEFGISLPGGITDHVVAIEEVSRRLLELVTGTAENQNQLLERYLGLIQQVADELGRRYSQANGGPGDTVR